MTREVPVNEQQALFAFEDPDSGDDVGYLGKTAMVAADITYRQLDYWARTGLVVPSVRPAKGSGSQRLYSFRDILVLKMVKRLLDLGSDIPKTEARTQAALAALVKSEIEKWSAVLKPATN